MPGGLIPLLIVALMGTVSAQLVYECFPNDTISVTNMDASHYIGAYANNSVGQCNTTFSSDYTILTIEGCGKSEDILLQLSNRSMGDTILGGSGIYLTIVRCDEIDATGVPRTIVANFSPTLPLTTQGAVTPSFGIDSNLVTGGTSASAYSDGTVITVADIGETIRWTVHVPSDYYAKLTSCTAYSGTSTSGTPSQLLSTNGCSADTSVVLDWDSSNSAVVGLERVYYTTIYAFRFYNSQQLFLYCDVKVCPTSGQSNCLMDCSKRRRRRAAVEVDEDEDGEKMSLITHTGTSITVFDFSNGAGNLSGLGVLTLTLTLMVSMVTG